MSLALHACVSLKPAHAPRMFPCPTHGISAVQRPPMYANQVARCLALHSRAPMSESERSKQKSARRSGNKLDSQLQCTVLSAHLACAPLLVADSHGRRSRSRWLPVSFAAAHGSSVARLLQPLSSRCHWSRAVLYRFMACLPPASSLSLSLLL